MIPISINMMEADAKTLARFASVGRTMQNVRYLLDQFAAQNQDPQIEDRINSALDDMESIGDVLSRLHLDVRDAIWKHTTERRERHGPYQENIGRVKMSTHLKADGQMIPVAPNNGKAFDLDELQQMVGGYIEVIGLPDGKSLVINEEGKLTGLPMNVNATRVFEAVFGAGSDVIVGDAVLVEKGQIE